MNDLHQVHNETQTFDLIEKFASMKDKFLVSKPEDDIKAIVRENESGSQKPEDII